MLFVRQQVCSKKHKTWRNLSPNRPARPYLPPPSTAKRANCSTATRRVEILLYLSKLKDLVPPCYATTTFPLECDADSLDTIRSYLDQLSHLRRRWSTGTNRSSRTKSRQLQHSIPIFLHTSSPDPSPSLLFLVLLCSNFPPCFLIYRSFSLSFSL